MVHIYYHIYAIEGVEEIIDEQLSLIEKHFDFPYILNVGISIAENNISTTSILEKIKPNLRDIRSKGNEWTTLDLIRTDAEKFGDSTRIGGKGVARRKVTNFNRKKQFLKLQLLVIINSFKF